MSLALGCGNKAGTPSSSDNSSAAPGSTPGGSTAPGGSSASGSGSAEAKATPQPVVIPAGKVITVRLGEALSSNGSQDGQGFSATVAKPVVVDGKTVIEAGAAARGTVVAAKGMGHFKGGALLQVRLTSVSIDG